MEKIVKMSYDELVGKIVYRERSDCSYWKLDRFSEAQKAYIALKLDDEGYITDEETFLTPSDLVGDFVV